MNTGGGTDLTVHQLRSFLVLAEELHFGRAAGRVFVSQPTLSRQLHSLEERLGVEMFTRSTRRVELTPAGEALIPLVRDALRAVDHIQHIADAHAQFPHGRLILGAIGAEAAMPYTQAILAELHSRRPGTVVEMRSLDFVAQIEMLTSGEVDAAFLRPPVPAGLRSMRLATEPRAAALPVRDPLATGLPVTLAQLADHVMLDVPADAPRQWWDEWTVNPRPDGRPVRFGPSVRDIEPMLLAVSRGEGIVFLPLAARVLYPRPGIVYADVIDLPPSTAALVWLPRNDTHPGLLALRAAAQAVSEQPDR